MSALASLLEASSNKMQRLLSVAALTSILSLTACGGGSSTSSDSSPDKGSDSGVGILPAVASQLKLLAGDIGSPGNIDGPANLARFNGADVVTVDTLGNILVAEDASGAVRKIDLAGNVSTFAGLLGTQGCADGPGTTARFGSVASMTPGNGGDIYLTDIGCSTIRKIDGSGTVTTIAGSVHVSGEVDGTGAAAQFYNPYFITFDKTSNSLYVSDYGRVDGQCEPFFGPCTYTYFAGSTIRKVTLAGVVTTVAGKSGTYGFADGPNTTALFNQPRGLAVDDVGNIFVNDCNNGAIRKIDKSGTVSTFVDASTDLVHCPSQLLIDANKNIVVIDSRNGIERISPLGPLLSTTPLPPSLQIFLAQISPISPNQNTWWQPATFDTSNQLLIAGYTAVQRLSQSGAEVTVAGSYYISSGSSDGTGSSAQFYGPTGLAVDATGNAYVADSGNRTIRKITAAGVVTTVAGSVLQEGNVDGAGPVARFTFPHSPIIDAAGNIYFGDAGNSIRKMTQAGLVTTIASGPSYQFGAMTADSAGTMYVANGKTIMKLSSSGTLTTYITSSDEIGAFAVDSQGIVYVTDPVSNLIRKITPQGVSSVFAGIYRVNGQNDGPGATATFAGPGAIVIDAANNLFVSDYFNNTIRRISPQGMVSTYLGIAGKVGIQPGPAPGSLYQPLGLAIRGNSLYLISKNAVLKTGP
ncbi:NHL repeat-containing protein [Undibacterium terreum]|uniref:NHL repeat-containing protein n=1 Tax=Undibacterium terreum TaxID=1224302 RepID=A0A916XP09_9BURK|nr:NHL repeat-containing protein [Undibacterium terreum]GGC87281.1 hypothetical protein GCM10011396_38190 [Undibacterium terreum]